MDKIWKISGMMLAAMMLWLTACNDSDEDSGYIVDAVDYTNTAITGFSLRSNSSVLNNLDSVYFAIDLNNARIFNADSLPYGTDVSSLGVVVTTEGSKVTAYSPTDDGTKEVNLTDEPTSKLNFSEGPIRIVVTSYDGTRTREYEVGVNVHKVVPDSLFWSSMAKTSLPGGFNNPVEQKTVKTGESAYCLVFDGTTYRVSKSDNLYGNEWETADAAFDEAVRTETFTATSDSFYVLTQSGKLLESADAITWDATGETWENIIAPYGSRLFGIATDGTARTFVTYPASTETLLPADFPVNGFSAPVYISTKWANDRQMLIFGGELASGAKTGASWAFDGNGWAKVAESLPAAAGYAVTSYTICETDTTSWRLKESEVLLAFGGTDANGEINRDVYMSRDKGITWKLGDSYIQLPEYMPTVSGADLVVFDTMMHLDSQNRLAPRSGGDTWSVMPLYELPSIYRTGGYGSTRGESVVTSWECPYIYVFGGTDSYGRLQNAVWRGVVNHFTFQPLQ